MMSLVQSIRSRLRNLASSSTKPPVASRTTSSVKLSITKHSNKNTNIMETNYFKDEKETIMDDEYGRDFDGCLLTCILAFGFIGLAILGIIYLFT